MGPHILLYINKRSSFSHRFLMVAAKEFHFVGKSKHRLWKVLRRQIVNTQVLFLFWWHTIIKGNHTSVCIKLIEANQQIILLYNFLLQTAELFRRITPHSLDQKLKVALFQQVCCSRRHLIKPLLYPGLQWLRPTGTWKMRWNKKTENGAASLALDPETRYSEVIFSRLLCNCPSVERRYLFKWMRLINPTDCGYSQRKSSNSKLVV